MIRAFILLATGTGAAQAIQFIAMPLLSEIYTPSDLGSYFSVIAAAAIFTIFIACQINTAIPNSAEEEVHKLVNLFMLIFTAAWFLAAAVFLFSKAGLQNKIFQIIVFSTLLSCSAVVKGLLLRLGSFRLLNFMMLTRNIIMVAIQLINYQGDGGLNLYVGFLIGECISILAVLPALKRYIKINSFRFEKEKILKIIVKKKNFLVTGTIQEFVAVSAFSFPIMIIPYIYNENLAGQYGMSARLVFPPAVLLLGAAVQAMYHQYGKRPRFAFFIERKKIFRYTLLFLVGAIPLVFLGAPFFMSLILGGSWTEAVNIASYLALWALFLLVSAPFRACCRMYSLQSLQLKIDASFLVCLISTAILAYLHRYEFSLIVILFSVLGIAQNCALIVAVFMSYLRSENYENK